MKCMKNKKGMYEFILTKSVMLIFIMGLVGIFWNMYTTLNIQSAGEIADSEAIRIAKQIDDAIGFKGISNTVPINLKWDLKVGKESVPYTMTINEQGVVVIEFVQYPYQEIFGIAQFGVALERTGSKSEIRCEWQDILNGVTLTIVKNSDYEYNTVDQQLYYIVSVTIDASDDCRALMEFEESFVEG
jgi:hypothetical protein